MQTTYCHIRAFGAAVLAIWDHGRAFDGARLNQPKMLERRNDTVVIDGVGHVIGLIL